MSAARERSASAAEGRLPLRASAPAKINLGLFVGPLRAHDRKHELASVVQAISLADELTLAHAADPARADQADEVICAGVELAGGENLAAVALRLFREATGWQAPPLRLQIEKRIPVAAGLGGGSADAAAALRLARHASGLGSDQLLLELAARLGADVPALLAPGRWLLGGAGERLRALPPPSRPFGVLLLASAAPLSTAAVYERAELLGIARSAAELGAIEAQLAAALELGAAVPAAEELLGNDLAAAASALRPEIARALEQALDAGADAAFVSGSGPTVAGLFLRANGPARAQRAAAGLAGRDPAPICAASLGASDISVRHNHDR